MTTTKAAIAKRQKIIPPLPFALQWCDARLAILLPEKSNRKLILSIAGLELASWLMIATIRALRDAAPVAAIAVNIVLGVTGIIVSVIYASALVLMPFMTVLFFYGRRSRSEKDGNVLRSLIATIVLLALNWKLFTALHPLLTLYGFYGGVR